MILVTLVTVSFIVLPASAFTQAGMLMNGPSFDLVESGGYLYVAQGSEVRVYDVSTSAKMSSLDWKDAIASIPIGSAVYGLEARDGYLYIAAAETFAIADLGTPDAPAVVGSMGNPYKGTEIRDVVLNGDVAYLTVVGGGVLVADISDKYSPRAVDRVILAGSNKPWRAALSGSSLYVGTAYDDQLVILDVSNPQKPIARGNYTPYTLKEGEYNSISGVAVKGNYAYIAEYHNGVRVIDVSNPEKPVEVDKLMDIDANDIKILGNKAYLSVRYQGFSIIDISDPVQIKIIGKAEDAPYYNEGIYPTEGYTYISLESLGFGIYDTSTLTRPVALTRVSVVGGADSLAVQGNYLYIGAHNDGIWVIDISDPAHPKEAGFISDEGRNTAVQIQDNLLYIAGTWSGIYVADISDPKNPRFVTEHFSGNLGVVLPDGNYFYTDEGIADYSNRDSPVYTAKSPYFNGEMAKYGNQYLLVASAYGTSNGLHVIDVSNKKSPVRVATFDPGVPYMDVCVSGNSAIALTENGIVAIDLSNPAKPKETSRLRYAGEWGGYSLVADGDTVYAAGNGQVRAFDISNRNKMKLVDTFTSDDDFSSVAYSDGFVFAGQKMGVLVLSPGGQSGVSRTVTTGIVTAAPSRETTGAAATGNGDQQGTGSAVANDSGGSFWDWILNFLKSIFPH